jgi:hypothetical protein
MCVYHPIKIKKKEMVRTKCTYGRGQNEYKVFVGKYDGMTLLGRTRYWRESNIKMNLKEMGSDWIHLA